MTICLWRFNAVFNFAPAIFQSKLLTPRTPSTKSTSRRRLRFNSSSCAATKQETTTLEQTNRSSSTASVDSNHSSESGYVSTGTKSPPKLEAEIDNVVEATDDSCDSCDECGANQTMTDGHNTATFFSDDEDFSDNDANTPVAQMTSCPRRYSDTAVTSHSTSFDEFLRTPLDFETDDDESTPCKAVSVIKPTVTDREL